MPKNGFRLFEFLGITVYLHWSWILVAAIEMEQRANMYQSFGWNIAEYLSLFAIVLMHEYGHALACRSVGGKADRIVLWPLGGVAYVSPPMRPGAVLWSIVAGPLVNVALLPLMFLAWVPASGDVHRYLTTVAWINLVLLLFNILPIYPLDGGKILWALLWFVIGRGKALMAASVVGMIGAAGLGLLALYVGDMWLGILAAFAAFQAWVGFNNAREIRRRENVPMRPNAACPKCGAHPPMGPFWVCPTCKARFDAFEHPIACPGCGAQHRTSTCMACGTRAPFAAWGVPMPPAEVIIPPNGSPMGPV